MFPKLRLLAPLCGAMVLANAPYARAQEAEPAAPTEQYPAPAQTPEAAGTAFYRLLDSISMMAQDQLQTRYGNRPATDVYYHYNLDSISRVQRQAIEALSSLGVPDLQPELLRVMARQKDEPQYEARVTATQNITRNWWLSARTATAMRSINISAAPRKIKLIRWKRW